MRKRRRQLAAAAGAAFLFLIYVPAAGVRGQRAAAGSAGAVAVPAGSGAAARAAYYQTQLRLQEDLEAFRQFRPAYPFWRHIYTVPDGNIIYGSAADGRLLATFPRRGNWARDGEWADPSLAGVLEGTELPRRLRDRRRAVEELLAVAAGPIVQNATRGRFLSRNAERHADFLRDWGAIYERFGVPAEIGLAQAIVESGLNGRARSQARALGFCQWLPRNWNRLKRLSPYGNRRIQPDHPGAVLRRLPHHPDDDVRQLHPGAVGAPRGRRQRGAHGGERRAAGRQGRPRTVPAGVGLRARAARHLRAALPRAVPHVRPPLGAVRRDGVRQHVQRAGDHARDAAVGHLRDARAAQHVRCRRWSSRAA